MGFNTKEIPMQKFLAMSALVVLALPVLAGNGFEGFRCENECPLAKQANLHRSYGTEATASSAVLRSAVAMRVEASLSRI